MNNFLILLLIALYGYLFYIALSFSEKIHNPEMNKLFYAILTIFVAPFGKEIFSLLMKIKITKAKKYMSKFYKKKAVNPDE